MELYLKTKSCSNSISSIGNPYLQQARYYSIIVDIVNISVLSHLGMDSGGFSHLRPGETFSIKKAASANESTPSHHRPNQDQISMHEIPLSLVRIQITRGSNGQNILLENLMTIEIIF